MTTIDHAAEAVAELGAVQLHYDEGMNGTARATIALVHAQLALVEAQREANEQARIANLVALFGLPTRDAEDMATLGVDYLDLAHQIKKGLGL